MNVNKQILIFENALDNLIKSELKNVTEKEVQHHFGSITLFEHIKLVVWSTRE